MTRINVIPVTELCNKHLFAEWREMPRLVSNLQATLSRKGKPFQLAEIPPEYKLGAGHVKFFFDKFEYLHERHKQLTQELLKRGYKLSHTDSDTFSQVEKRWYGSYTPTEEAIRVNRERIAERLGKKDVDTL